MIDDDPLVYLNGVITPISQAMVPVLDRGFIFGDGIYDVIPVYDGKPFRGREHLARLFRSMASIGIENPYNEVGWNERVDSIIAANGPHDQMVYIQVTRGVAKRGHAFPAKTTPTVFIMSNPLVLPNAQAHSNGVACVTMEDQRWLRCDIKSISLLGNVLAAQRAAENHVTEAIQFRDGYLSEASSSNVWIAKDGKLMAPPKDNLILEGIRYSLIEELCAHSKIDFSPRKITREEVFDADEIMLSSASKEILPVVRVDDRIIGSGKPGPIYASLYSAYQKAKRA
ncbi:MAG: D-amino acid aminotransferase [Herbaspirillum sp.]|nr:D-amino acid aminotransferase [Herbaspirillum sp.]